MLKIYKDNLKLQKKKKTSKECAVLENKSKKAKQKLRYEVYFEEGRNSAWKKI